MTNISADEARAILNGTISPRLADKLRAIVADDPYLAPCREALRRMRARHDGRPIACHYGPIADDHLAEYVRFTPIPRIGRNEPEAFGIAFVCENHSLRNDGYGRQTRRYRLADLEDVAGVSPPR